MELPQILSSNQVFSGGLALGAVAAAFAYGRQYLLLAASYFYRRFVAEAEIRDGDMVGWLGLWLSHTDYGMKCRRMFPQVRYMDTQPGEIAEGAGGTIFLEPGIGPHFFRVEGTLVWLDRRRDQPTAGGPPVGRDHFFLRILGSRERLAEILEIAKNFSVELLSRRHVASVSDGRGGWERLTVGLPRRLSTVVLPGSTADDLAEDARRFLGRRSWYAERGIPWRRGYMLFGPPGTGKTSLVRALAHELGLPLYVLDLTAKEFSDMDLVGTLSRLPVGAVLLIEDLDEQLVPEKGSYITLSGLLNALDGPLANEGRLLFVTTNAPERLDAALDRDGRIDVRLHLDYACAEQAERMFLNFFPDRADLAGTFGAALGQFKLSPAAVQGFLSQNSEDPEKAVATVGLLACREMRVVRRGLKGAA